ncbi:hypothetical protein PsYK624_015470 [Phanerochaete sordida]|uniref:Uncharacterized protein n=1 Tax=Phanerochaete sordida TaxID=48140 RepID=A0A9P3L8Y5_9APHY|nr:hypothetical protein PsYK624_015470 [Phanerochaete sordida]
MRSTTPNFYDHLLVVSLTAFSAADDGLSSRTSKIESIVRPRATLRLPIPTLICVTTSTRKYNQGVHALHSRRSGRST